MIQFTIFLILMQFYYIELEDPSQMKAHSPDITVLIWHIVTTLFGFFLCGDRTLGDILEFLMVHFLLI